ncbi:MAG: wax ester/triacylglycerol synthase family O-acyltransferase [Mycobacterium sp.]|nr:wax ester/triacylglycerol synthase family O-acyltransferase [Mycobacterium sp.]
MDGESIVDNEQMARRARHQDARQRLGIQDALWLEMDRPNNLMVVDSVVWTAEPLDFDRLRDVVSERLVDRYPVFSSKAVRDDDGSWWWEHDPDFTIDNHVSLISLKRPDDPRELQALVAAHRTEMLNRDHPLWQSIWIKRYGQGSAMILRSHHAIADGMRMVQLAMSLFDALPDGGPILAPAVIQAGAQPHPPGQSLGMRVRSGLTGAGRVAEAARSLLPDGDVVRRVVKATPSASCCWAPATTRRSGPGRPGMTRAWRGRNRCPWRLSKLWPRPTAAPSTTYWWPASPAHCRITSRPRTHCARR